ncbi:TMEM175 family protein [Phenylobacterium montanum]|uniref:DUF1211 domain-containing protein n=1 Tax=Phenylobacterium montanum TaxID=2823693 RepID=A0A975G2A9_9CAUL|nr:TMEM175 family protein [Caulobacter sp. S6]QUD89575.1 DUF1211 domain-containing protein [Caulobacter sp. S6]
MIAIIITIMVLDLRPPVSGEPSALLALWPVLLSYALSFVLVAIYWVNHHHLLQAARRVGPTTLWLNLHLLFWLSLFPFATAYLGAMRGTAFPIAVYAGLSEVVAFAYLLLARDLTRRNFDAQQIAGPARRHQFKNFAAMLATGAAIPVVYLSRPLALILLAAPAAAYFIPDVPAPPPRFPK